MNSILKRLNDKAARSRMPIMAAMELLPVCNLQCKMCYVRKSMAQVQAGGGLKSADWWLALAREARDAGLLSPLLTGGEPLLHPQFREILTGMQELGLQVSINSNGTLVDRDWAQWLGAHRPTRINITLYGASAESYERLCGNGAAYDRLRCGLELLKQAQVPVKFNTSITPENAGDLERIIAFAKNYGAPLQTATYMFPPLRRDGTMVGRNERLTPEQAALARVTADFHQSEPQWFVAQAMRYRQFVPLDHLKHANDHEIKMKMTCRAGLSSFWIDWQGNMMNCGMYGSAQVKLDGRDFQTAWQELVEQTARLRFAPDCAVCPNRMLCHPCVAMIYNECGTADGRPDYICRMQQTQAELYWRFAQKHYSELIPTVDSTAGEEVLDDCGF